MKTFNYCADIGCVRVVITDGQGKPLGATYFANGHGDGYFSLYVVERLDELEDRSRFKYVESIDVGANTYITHYDCDRFDSAKALELGPGCYEVYSADGDMAFKRGPISEWMK